MGGNTASIPLALITHTAHLVQCLYAQGANSSGCMGKTAFCADIKLSTLHAQYLQLCMATHDKQCVSCISNTPVGVRMHETTDVQICKKCSLNLV